MKRLPEAQERRLLSKVLYGHFGGGKWETVKALLKKGYVKEEGKNIIVTPKGKQYVDKYHEEHWWKKNPVPPIWGEMAGTMAKSLEQLRKRISKVRYGPPGTILFDFDGVTYAAPEPMDVMPVGGSEIAAKKWALRQLLDKKAVRFTRGNPLNRREVAEFLAVAEKNLSQIQDYTDEEDWDSVRDYALSKLGNVSTRLWATRHFSEKDAMPEEEYRELTKRYSHLYDKARKRSTGWWKTNPLTYDEFHKKIALVEVQRDQARELLKTDPHAAEEHAYIGLGILENIEEEAGIVLSVSYEKKQIVQRLRAALNQIIGWADQMQGRPIPNPIGHSLEDLKNYAAQVLAAGQRAGDTRTIQRMLYRTPVGKRLLPSGEIGKELSIQMQMDETVGNIFYTALARWLENAYRYTHEDRRHLASLAWWYVNLITTIEPTKDLFPEVHREPEKKKARGKRKGLGF